MYVLDTDHMSVLERGGEGSIVLRERLRVVAPDDYGTTIITYEEQVRGWLAEISRAKTAEAETQLYDRLGENLQLYLLFSVWRYDRRSAALFNSLIRQKIRIGTMDLKIAAITLANDAILLTRNTRDFSRVPGLSFADWTQ